jgi:crossover junction endodeoxyribonuclease RusA
MKVVAVTLPFPDKRLNPNNANGMHWSATSGLRKRAHADGFWLARQAAREVAWVPACGDVPLRVTFAVPDRRPRDRDNLMAAMKAALDGVAEALGLDDNQFEPTIVRRTYGGKPGAVHIEIGGKGA